MIHNIINAIKKECKRLVQDHEGIVIFDTNLNDDMEFSLPLVVLECSDAPESAALPNGVCRMDWSFRLRVYAQEPDAYADDDDRGSTDNLEVIDLIKNHFIKGVWITEAMTGLTTTYQFRMTYNGTYPAAELKTEDRAIKGFSHGFETIGFDYSVDTTVYMVDETQTVEGDFDFE